ncbi:hypothetical protein [Enemella evansiae]|uniref:hypothetical protein n=1 Tax=Enemella evansiae TaxID=2016499 RepID=UPI001E3E4DDC|nr:hypothetical protein [Enemella evansiae]
MRTSSNDFDVDTLWSDLNNTAAWQVQNTTSAVTTQRIDQADRGGAREDPGAGCGA